MGPSIIPSEVDANIPDSTEVVIVGGGIIGIAAAYYLARRKVPVVVCEKGHFAGEQSSRNLGWIRKLLRGPELMPLTLRSDELWAGLNADLGAETGYRQKPMVIMARNEKIAAIHQAWLNTVRGTGLSAHFASNAEIAELLPGLRGRWSGGLVDRTSGGAEPTHATSALVGSARRHGAVVANGVAVRHIETAGGEVCGVVTEAGTIRCRTVVLACGAWTRLFCKNLGIDFPQLNIMMSIGRSRTSSGASHLLLGADNILMRPHIDGGHVFTDMCLNTAPIVPDSFRLFPDYMRSLVKNRRYIRIRLNRRFLEEWALPDKWSRGDVTPFEQMRVLDPRPVKAAGRKALDGLTRLLPGFSDASVHHEWAGFVDFTPDEVPVMSHVQGHPGLVLASGFSALGFGAGPAAGELVADLVMGSQPKVDPKPFRFDRFDHR